MNPTIQMVLISVLAAGATLILTWQFTGRWTMRREESHFIVVFHRFADGKETLLGEFPTTEQGEVDAKACALAAQDNLRFS